MITEDLIKVYSDNTEAFIVASAAKMAKSLSVKGSYDHMDDLLYSKILYFLMQDMSLYTDEIKAFLYSEIEKLSIKPNVCKPRKI